jgi:hypothetical protein
MTETIDVLRTFCDVEKVTDVLVTNDYHLFGFINGNRELNQTNLNNIKESLKTKQILESAIIVGLDKNPKDKKPFKIIEGQHRFTACSELNLPVSFITGIIGLPSPINYYGVPLIFATASFVLVHATAVRYQKWGYFKRFTAPFAIFLPINLLTFLSPIVSLSFRMFGNALAGEQLVPSIPGTLQR